MSAIVYKPRERTIRPNHTCDRCERHATVEITMPDFLGFCLCDLHYREHEAELLEEAMGISDQRESVAPRSPAALAAQR